MISTKDLTWLTWSSSVDVEERLLQGSSSFESQPFWKANTTQSIAWYSSCIHQKHFLTFRFSRRMTSQLQNWAFFTYLDGKPRNTYMYLMQERQNIGNTSRHQEVVMSSLNLSCYIHFSFLKTLNVRYKKL